MPFERGEQREALADEPRVQEPATVAVGTISGKKVLASFIRYFPWGPPRRATPSALPPLGSVPGGVRIPPHEAALVVVVGPLRCASEVG